MGPIVTTREATQQLIWSLVQVSSGAGEQLPALPEVPLMTSDMPLLSVSHMPVPIFSIAFASYWWVRPDGRLLTLEELEGILHIFYPDQIFHAQHRLRLFDQLESSDAENTTRVLNFLDEQKKQGLKRLAEICFLHFLKVTPGAQSRAQNLIGFEGRLNVLWWTRSPYAFGYRKRPTIDGKECRDDQLYLIHWLCNECTDDEGDLPTEWDVVTMVGHHYNIDIRIDQRFEPYVTLADPANWTSRMVENALRDDKHATHFGRKADLLHRECTKLGLLMNPALIPEEVE